MLITRAELARFGITLTIQHSIQLARLAGNPVKRKFEFKFIYSHLFNCYTATVRKKKEEEEEEVKTEITNITKEKSV